MKYDLHIHTTCSDGKYSKLELLKYFNSNNYETIAFSDHNCIELVDKDYINKKYEEKYSEKQKVDIIDAVEFDVSENRFLHILGYGIKNKNKIFEKFKSIRKINTEITKKIINNINAVYNIDINFEQLINESLDGNINKSDITRWMVSNGYAKNYIEAGYLYTSKESPCYEKRFSLSIDEIINLISECGGISIMAHPFSLKLSNDETKKIICDLVKRGVNGIEVNNLDKTTPNQVCFLKILAKELSIYQTSGSDFHNEISTPKIGLENHDSDEFIRILRRNR